MAQTISIAVLILLAAGLVALLALFPSAGQYIAQKAQTDPPLAINQRERAVPVYADPIPIVLAPQSRERETVVLNGEAFDVEVVRTDADRRAGLSGHAPLEAHEGMLFVFDKADLYGFWMKDMTFPIDILWLDENKQVVHIVSNAAPDSYPAVFTPKRPSRYVLEVSAGTVERLGVNIGDTAP